MRPTPARASVAAIGLGLALTGALLAAAAPMARAQGSVDEAEALIRRGTELRHQGQDAQALPYFDSAYKLSRNPRTAAQLGLVKMALGYCVDAERLLDEALAVPDHPWISRNQATLEKTRASARKNIGEVSVTGAPAGAQVLVNGHPAGNLPLAAPLRFDKGPIELQVRAPAYEPVTRSLVVTGGGRETLTIVLVPVGTPGPVSRAPAATTTVARAPAAAATAAPTSAPVPVAGAATSAGATTSAGVAATNPPASASAAPGAEGAVVPAPAPSPAAEGDVPRPAGGAGWLRPAAWIAGGGALVGLAFGVTETLIASHRIDDFNRHTAPSPTLEDPNHQAPDCETAQLSEACRSIRDAHDHARTLAIVGYVGAGVLAATSATLFVLATRRPAGALADRDGPALACAPALPAAGLTMTCRLRF